MARTIVGSWHVNPGFKPGGKSQQIHAGSVDAVWIDPSGFAATVIKRKAAFETTLHEQQSAL